MTVVYTERNGDIRIISARKATERENIMKVKYELDEGKQLTKKQKQMLEGLRQRPDTFDDDNPELTTEQLEEFRRISEIKRNERKKQTVSIRLSPGSLRKARSLGKGYTSVLSRILEETLNDNESLKRFL